jgi:Na+(H+)/acetate symporter ActP
VTTDQGLYIGAALVFIYAVLGGMKGITYTQVAQYIVLIIAYCSGGFHFAAIDRQLPAADRSDRLLRPVGW